MTKTNPLEDVLSKGIMCLIAKLLTNLMYNREAFKQTMRKIWRLKKPIHFHELGSRIVLIEFEETRDKRQSLEL